MDETRYIRGRRVVFERREPVENLPFTLDVFDVLFSMAAVLGRADSLSEDVPQLLVLSVHPASR